MGVVSAPEERVFGEIKRLCYAGLDATRLRVEAAEILRRAVPFERHCLITTDPLSGLPTDVVMEGLQEGELLYQIGRSGMLFSCSVKYRATLSRPLFGRFLRPGAGLLYCPTPIGFAPEMRPLSVLSRSPAPGNPTVATIERKTIRTEYRR
jgi:hypothetical protein